MTRVFSALCFLFLLSCSSRIIKSQVAAAEAKWQDHTGFMLYDPVRKKNLVTYRSAQYFTPASNTKILTFYTGLQLLGDSVPSIRFRISGDSLIFWGMGDPSFLYRHVHANDRVYSFLKNNPRNIYFSSANFHTENLGPGWAWDDYPYSYSAERSAFPIYGNCISAIQDKEGQLSISPAWFYGQLEVSPDLKDEPEIVRDLNTNRLTIYESSKPVEKSWEIPFHAENKMIARLLSDTLHRPVTWVNLPLTGAELTLKSMPADSLYRVMMHDSDNFIAEQLLLMAAAVVSDTLKPELAIQYMQEHHLKDLPDEPAWVDGSGLSRFNLVTPRSVVALWEKIYMTITEERLFKLVAVGGQSGTLKNSFKDDPPFLFGKTGSLSNHLSLSGFIRTKRGRTLIFSFMNSSNVASSAEVRRTRETILRQVRERF